ncbi:MAG TPA: hypothetical protein VN442_02940 [Bryobacteraceae bacterium]|nr:hypothetical protein [Bryobacteraceae bacterium]
MNRVLAAALLLLPYCAAETRTCDCSLSDPAKIETRQCSLCREAEKHPPEQAFFYLKDVNPRKPNRWLVLPRAHFDGPDGLRSMTQAHRTALWTAAIAKAQELWGDQWAVAINGDEVRTQCHAHVHIGKLLQGVEIPNFVLVDGPAAIPAPRDGTGLWVHPVNGKLHVHQGEQITETVLLR